jgi:hypothetical protein
MNEHDVPGRRGPPAGPDATRAPCTATLKSSSCSARIGSRAAPSAAASPNDSLTAAYQDVGLSATHIEQLTGQPTELVLAELRSHDIRVRSKASFSPWFLRQRTD